MLVEIDFVRFLSVTFYRVQPENVNANKIEILKEVPIKPFSNNLMAIGVHRTK